MKRLSGPVIVLLVLMVAAGIGLAALIEHRGCGALPRTERALRTVWTPDEQEKLRTIWAKDAVASMSFLSNERDREQMVGCLVSRLMAACPGGPAELQRRAPAGQAGLGSTVSTECVLEFSERVAFADKWDASFLPVYVGRCVASMGEGMRASCECIAKHASDAFSSPAAFTTADRRARDTLSGTDRQRLESLARFCGERDDQRRPAH